MHYLELKDYINTGKLDKTLELITCAKDVSDERQRYLDLLDKAVEAYGEGDWHFISSPGRSEIGGNHTDHQHGHVLACALNIDNLVCVKANDDYVCRYKDVKHDFEIDLNDLSKHENEVNASTSLVRGIAYRLKELGYKIGGFDAICDTRVLVGSGISSSASYEVMIVEVFNALYNEEKISAVERAIISQYAENNFFGKPCGLMDQMAISVGGFTGIDFYDPNKPVIDNTDFSFSDYGYELVLVNTKGDHADLSHEYAAIPNEIKAVANYMGVDYLADQKPEYFYEHIEDIRREVKNDRAVLRTYHFYQEDKRAIEEKNATKEKDINKLLELMNKSGRSSYMFLQNVYPASRPESQSLAVGLAICELVLGDKGAYRVHGGGFDGTIQVVVPQDKIAEFKKAMTAVFGEDSMLFVRVRSLGTKEVL